LEEIQTGDAKRQPDTRSVVELRIRDKFTTAQPVTNIYVTLIFISVLTISHCWCLYWL